MRCRYGLVVSLGMGLLALGCLPSSGDGNDPPLAGDDVITTQAATAVDINVLANDSDPDGDVLTIKGNTDPDRGGTVLLVGGKLRYTPAAGMSGTDSFTYTISDGHGHEVTATVVVTVNPAAGTNQPPETTPDSAGTTDDTPVTIDVLQNDSDPDADALSIVADGFSAPAHGTVVDNGDGTLTYTPEAGSFGTYTFTYTVTDGQNGYDIGTVTVLVASAAGLQSDTKTREAVMDLLQAFDDGSTEDFAAVIVKLDEATALDSSNENPIFFKALSEFLLWVQQTMLSQDDAVGKGRVLYESTGVTNVDASVPKTLHTMDLQDVPHTQGDLIDTFPTTDEIDGFVYGEFRARVLQLVNELDAVPETFEYAIDFHDLPTWQDDPMTRWIDHGDVSAMQAMFCFMLAFSDMAMGIDLGNVDANTHFDEADLVAADPTFQMDEKYIIDLLKTEYTDTLKPISARWSSARSNIDRAFEYYVEVSEHVRSETAVQQDNGLLTLGGDTFDTEAERDEFLADEAEFRAFAEDIVDALYTSSYTQTEEPDGTPTHIEDQMTVNPKKLFSGIDIRKLLFHPIEIDEDGDPATTDDITTTLGFTSVDDYTLGMATIDGVVLAMAGRQLTANDAQNMMPLPLFITDPAVDTKTIDGAFGDWGASACTQAGLRPFASLDAPRPDVGEIFVAVDATNLYVHVSADITNTTTFTHYAIRIEGDMTAVEASTGYMTPGVAREAGTGGVEISVPLSNFTGDYGVRLEVGVEWQDPGDPYDIDGCWRENMFVAIQ